MGFSHFCFSIFYTAKKFHYFSSIFRSQQIAPRKCIWIIMRVSFYSIIDQSFNNLHTLLASANGSALIHHRFTITSSRHVLFYYLFHYQKEKNINKFLKIFYLKIFNKFWRLEGIFNKFPWKHTVSVLSRWLK